MRNEKTESSRQLKAQLARRRKHRVEMLECELERIEAADDLQPFVTLLVAVYGLAEGQRQTLGLATKDLCAFGDHLITAMRALNEATLVHRQRRIKDAISAAKDEGLQAFLMSSQRAAKGRRSINDGER